MPSKILLIGAGNLGTRYLQGIKMVNTILNIHVYDISKVSLTKAKNYYDAISENKYSHEIVYTNNLETLPSFFDIIIISTTADVRLEIIEKIVFYKIEFTNIILEKVFAQSLYSINKISSLLRGKNAWVNTPRRMIDWYRTIKSKIKPNMPIQMSIIGGNWGLACNSIHFIDLINFFTNETVVRIDTSNLSNEWEESKRSNFFEIHGKLEIFFSNGSYLILESNKLSFNSYLINFHQNNINWVIDESNGIAKNSNGLLIEGDLTLQSKLTPILVEHLIYENFCNLTDLTTSAKLHLPLINSLLSHWNTSMNKSDEILPIT